MQNDQTIRLLLIAGSLIIFPMMAYHRYRAGTGEPLDRRQEGLLALLVIRPVGLATMGGLFTYLVNPEAMAWSSLPLPTPLRWAGLACSAIAGLLLFWTVHNLGPNLTDTVVTRRIHTLVTAGPYRWVRHPFYDSVGLLLLGNALAAANWFVFAGGVVLLTMLRLRTNAEEARLLARFGDAYRTYMAHTGRFVPRLGRTAAGLSHSRA
jgi:protein-S-isoprenylcysteine O-methyltransferase Ste14